MSKKTIRGGHFSFIVDSRSGCRLVPFSIIMPQCRYRRSRRQRMNTMPNSRTVFDIACLNEQPSNKLRLHTLCYGGKLQRSSRGITHEQSHGYVRLGTMPEGLGIRLRAVVPGLWGADPHEPLHLSPCIRLPLSGPT